MYRIFIETSCACIFISFLVWHELLNLKIGEWNHYEKEKISDSDERVTEKVFAWEVAHVQYSQLLEDKILRVLPNYMVIITLKELKLFN